LKKIFIIFMCLFFVFSISACNKGGGGEIIPPTKIEDEINEVNVIVLMGQSNAEGHTWNNMLKLTDEETYNRYTSNDQTNVKMMYLTDALKKKNMSDGFEDIRLGMGYDSSRFGPEIGMSMVFDSKELKRDLYIIKYTAGATSLYKDWHSTSTSKGQGLLYTGFLNFVYDALAVLEEEGYFPFIKGFCFMQGEADSTSDHLEYATYYEEYLDLFINDLNEDLSYYKETEDEVFKFVDAGISNSSPWFNYVKINNAKYKCAQKDTLNRYYLDTISLGLRFNLEPTNNVDFYHYDSLSMIELGKEFAEAMLTFGVL